MIKFKPLYSVIIGVALMATAMGALYYSWVRGPAPPGQLPPAPTERILVASSDIPFGTPLTPLLIKEVEWPKDSLPADAVLRQKELLTGPEGNRVALSSFVAGEPLLKAKISGFGEKPTLSRKVSREMRAFSISISDVSGVAGFLMPGDRVDVLLTRQWPVGSGILVTDVILQNLPVLGIDQLSDEQSYKPVVARTATVEVSPADAQKLALAVQLGSLSLALRNHADAVLADPGRVSSNDLSGAIHAVGRPQGGHSRGRLVPESRVNITIRRGTDVKVEQVAE